MTGGDDPAVRGERLETLATFLARLLEDLKLIWIYGNSNPVSLKVQLASFVKLRKLWEWPWTIQVMLSFLLQRPRDFFASHFRSGCLNSWNFVEAGNITASWKWFLQRQFRGPKSCRFWDQQATHGLSPRSNVLRQIRASHDECAACCRMSLTFERKGGNPKGLGFFRCFWMQRNMTWCHGFGKTWKSAMWARRKDLSKETPQTLAEVHEKALLRQLVIEDESQH